MKFKTKPQRQLPVDDPNCKSLVRNLHLCPSFEELEGGFAPTLSELNGLIDLDIGVNHILPQYFNTKYRDDIDYHECRYERLRKYVTIPPTPQVFPTNKFDYSIFPDDLVGEIHNLLNKQDISAGKIKSADVSSSLPTSEESPGCGPTNRKRIADLLKSYSDTPSDSTGTGSYASSLSDRKEDSAFSSTPSPEIHSLNSTNPFLNGSLWKSTNPFSSDLSPSASPPIIPEPTKLPSRFAPKQLNPFAKSWSHDCAKNEKAVQVGEGSVVEHFPALPSLPVPIVPRKIRTPPGFERMRGPQQFGPGLMQQQQFNHFRMDQPQFYHQQRFPYPQFPGYPAPPYGMPMSQGLAPPPPMMYPFPPQTNEFGSYMSSTLHSRLRHPLFRPPMMGPPQGYPIPPS